MDNILQHPLREQAGPDTYNRYEFQVGWSVLQAIQKYERNISFIHFMEYHDDMSEVVDSNKMNFYQVKTKNSANFTFNLITKKHAKKTHSFLGYLFYNHYHFKEDCKATYFISNRPFDEKINLWQSIIQDNKSLLDNEPELYNEILNILKREYNFNSMNTNSKNHFIETFDKFIQNTYFKQTDVPLVDSYDFIKTRFFNAIRFEKIELSSAHLIFDNIFEEVRKRTKQKIKAPVSFNELKEKKGIDESIFSNIKNLRDKENILSIKKSITEFCLENRTHFPITKEKQLLRAITIHYKNILEITNISYKQEITHYINEFKKILDENLESLDSIEKLITLMNHTIDSILPKIENPLIKRIILEVLFYVEFLEIE